MDSSSKSSCPFCKRIEARDLVAENELAAALVDAFPLTRGHRLIVPKRHEPDFFSLGEDEHRALWDLMKTVKAALDEELRPDAYNIGINAGREAGQTVFHVHLHLIPRFQGDVPDPRGGIRWIFPDKAKYWNE
jgi:diadenosine tetraphosphate (Ap4A) HIT family hydrolase